MDKFMKENFCRENPGDYAKIFETPINEERKPNNVNPQQFPRNSEENYEYTRHQYARHGVRSNKISQQYRYAY